MRALAEGIWIVDRPFSLMGIRLGNRMAVLRGADGSTTLYAPVPLGDEEASAIRALGEVRLLVAPNLLHHLALQEARRHFPEARLRAPRGLGKKRPDLSIDDCHGDPPPPAWEGVIEAHALEGAPALRETVLHHLPSRTLICADLLFHFRRAEGLLTRLYLLANGALGGPAQTRLLRAAFRDRAAARASIDRLLELDFDRVVMAHGEVIESGGKEALRDATSWLRG